MASQNFGEAAPQSGASTADGRGRSATGGRGERQPHGHGACHWQGRPRASSYTAHSNITGAGRRLSSGRRDEHSLHEYVAVRLGRGREMDFVS